MNQENPKSHADLSSFTDQPVLKNPENLEYFQSLPAALQETIMQSGVTIESREHLKKLARHFSEGER